MVDIGRYRYTLEDFGRHWYTSVDIGTYWYILEKIGTHWYILVDIGRHVPGLVVSKEIIVAYNVFNSACEFPWKSHPVQRQDKGGRLGIGSAPPSRKKDLATKQQTGIQPKTPALGSGFSGAEEVRIFRQDDL